MLENKAKFPLNRLFQYKRVEAVKDSFQFALGIVGHVIRRQNPMVAALPRPACPVFPAITSRSACRRTVAAAGWQSSFGSDSLPNSVDGLKTFTVTTVGEYPPIVTMHG